MAWLWHVVRRWHAQIVGERMSNPNPTTLAGDGPDASPRAARLNWAQRLAEYFNREPTRFLAWIVFAQVLLWTAAPALLFRSLPLDMVENVAWGHEWQLGYYKHPPLQAWIVGLTMFLSRGVIWPLYLLGPIATALTFIPIFLLGREAAGPKAGLFAVILFSMVFYANLASTEFNANVLQLPIWSWAAFFLWRALQRDKIGWWLLLGAAISLAIYAKYSAVVLVMSLVLAGILQPEGRQRLRGGGPYVTVAASLLLSTPQFIWLWQSDWLPLNYAAERAADLTPMGRLLRPLGFLFAQLLDHAAALLLVLIGWLGWSRQNGKIVTFHSTPRLRLFVTVLAFAPIFISILMAAFAGEGLRDMWGAPMVIWLTLALVLWIKPAYIEARLPALLATWLSLFLAAPLIYCAISQFGPVFGAAPQRSAWPSDELAEQLTQVWRKETGMPLRLVAGNTWESGLVSAYSPDQPSVYAYADQRLNPWVDPDRIAKQGLLLVWPANWPTLPEVYSRLGPFSATGEVTAPFAGSRVPDARMRWAIRPPHPS